MERRPAFRSACRRSWQHRALTRTWPDPVSDLDRLQAAEDVESGLGQMPGYRAHSPAVAFALSQPRVEPAEMPRRQPPVIQRHGIGPFRECTFQITIHVGPRLTVALAVQARRMEITGYTDRNL
jgi:hypothetical protein